MGGDRMTKQKLVITFPTTTAAIAWERVCKSENLPGRLIPVPPKIKAGCGLAWLTTVEQRKLLLAGVEEFNLDYDAIVELEEG